MKPAQASSEEFVQFAVINLCIAIETKDAWERTHSLEEADLDLQSASEAELAQFVADVRHGVFTKDSAVLVLRCIILLLSIKYKLAVDFDALMTPTIP